MAGINEYAHLVLLCMVTIYEAITHIKYITERSCQIHLATNFIFPSPISNRSVCYNCAIHACMLFDDNQ